MSATPTILVYEDYVQNNALLHRALRDYAGASAVGVCDAHDIANGALDRGVDLFIMPGGADLYYCEKLNGAGNAAIHQYVENGGTYLGICAGAYYACRDIAWAADVNACAIMGARELAFFPGTATGPIADFIEDGDVQKSWHHPAPITWADTNETISTTAHYFGGPVFTGADTAPGVTVLARYTSLPGAPAAIVECSVGNGRAILCSPHLEDSAATLPRTLYRHMNPAFTRDTAVINTLAENDQSRATVWARLLFRAVNP